MEWSLGVEPWSGAMEWSLGVDFGVELQNPLHGSTPRRHSMTPLHRLHSAILLGTFVVYCLNSIKY